MERKVRSRGVRKGMINWGRKKGVDLGEEERE